MTERASTTIIRAVLQVAVPMRIDEHHRRLDSGAVSLDDLVVRARELADVVACQSDVLQRPDRRGAAGEMLNRLAEALSIMAVVTPGGVRLFGDHYEARWRPEGRPCTKVHGLTGPRCALAEGHDGPHLYRCAAPGCPGLPWAASAQPHPGDCGRAEGRR